MMASRCRLRLAVILVGVAIATAAEVKLMALVHRHGDRSPVGFMPNDPNNDKWPEGPGQLTAIGMQQLHRLGVSLRERYITNAQLIPGNYSKRHVHVRSTDVDRTLMSAQSLLQGLYPPGSGPQNSAGPGLTEYRLQPIPVHTIPASEDHLLRGYSSCPKYSLLKNQRYQNSMWKEVRKEHASFVQQVTTLSGFPDGSVDVSNMFKIRDPLVCDAAHNFTWPPGITQGIYEESATLADLGLAQMFTGTEQRLLTSGEFLDEIRTRMAQGAQGLPQTGWEPIDEPGTTELPGDKLGPRVWLYSAHDTTVAAVLSGMDLFDGHNPPYGSSVVFELMDQSMDAGVTEDYAVRMYYNKGVDDLWQDSSILTLAGCSEMCPLSKFLDIIEPFTMKNVPQACVVPPASPHPVGEEEPGTIVPIVLVSMVMIALIVIVVLAACKAYGPKKGPAHHRLPEGDVAGPEPSAGAIEMSASSGKPAPADSFAIAIGDSDEDDTHRVSPHGH